VREVVIDGYNGRIVRHDAGELTQAFRELLSDASMRVRMQSASRALFLQNFHMRIFVAGIMAVHQAVREQSTALLRGPVAAE
jgi:glycosyltransferase involved in cell wall biosynthesis